MKFSKIIKSKQHPHHNSNHWWLLKDREITRKNGEAFKVAVEDVLNDQRSFDLLDRKIVTREDGELFKKVIDYAIKEGYSYDLLWQKFVTKNDKELFDKVVKQAIKDHWGNELIKDKIITEEELELYKNKDNKIEAAIQQPNKPKPTTMLPDNMTWSWDPNAQDWVAVLKDNTNVTPPLYDPNNQNVVNQTTSYMSNIKSASCLSKFLDGPQYSKEIKIEAGLIKEGLVKYAGFDFNRGTKYEITEKGLKVLRNASEKEHNEALNEREKLAYLFGFNTDEVSTLDTTGKVIKQSAKKWTICEADGTELGEVEADNELDAKVKFGIEHPEYAESLSISAKEIKSSKIFFVEYRYPARTEDAWYITTDKVEANKEEEALQIAKEKLVGADNFHIVNKGFSNSDLYTKDSKPKYFHQDWYYDGEKLINEYTNFDKDAKYEETTETHEPYPNPSETPHDDIVLENHTGWVNTAKLRHKDDYRKLFSLSKLLQEYLKQEFIIPAELPDDEIDEDNKELIIGTAEVINELEHKVKDLGFYCEPIFQSEDENGAIYALKIFLD